MIRATRNRWGISQDSKDALRNPWVLAVVAGILFVIGVNASFIVAAITTSPGLVDPNYYEKGRDHERRFADKVEMRNRLGWTMRLDTPTEIRSSSPGAYTLNVVDKVGLPLRRASVTFTAYRPSDATADFTLPMEEVYPGVYQARAVLPLKGIWDINITVQHKDNALNYRHRISALP